MQERKYIFSKYPQKNVITCATFVTSLLGILVELSHNRFLTFLHPLSLSWIEKYDFRIYPIININNLFYTLLFIGGILYLSTSQKESRLIRFVFSVIFISKLATTLYSILRVIFPQNISSISTSLLYILIQFGWIFLSYQILKILNNTKTLSTKEVRYGDYSETYFIDASLWQRLFHLITDSIIALSIFYPILKQLIWHEKLRPFFTFLENFAGERFSLLIIIVICRLFFYAFSEFFLEGSPAKFLTETKVTNNKGDSVTGKTSLIRTLFRFVPFEAFSFLSNQGWHDKWSKTAVVQEKRTGVKGNLYFWLIPFLIAFAYIITLSINKYTIYQLFKAANIEQNSKTKNMESAIDNINNNTFLKLEPQEYSETMVFLKAEKIQENEIIFSKIIMDKYNIIPQELETFYIENRDSLSLISITKDDLKNAFLLNKDINAKAFKVDSEYYYIESIDYYFMPNLKLYKDDTIGSGHINIFLLNKGWIAELTDITVKKGNIKIYSILPLKLPVSHNRKPTEVIRLDALLNDYKEKFILDLSITDSLNRKHLYEISGNNNENQKMEIRLLKNQSN